MIDLGFNSAKMVSYEVAPDKSFRAFRQDGARVRLGEGLNETGFLSNEPIRRTIESLKIFREAAKLERVDRVFPVATSAVREAGNRGEFLEKVRAETGLEFRVLSPRDEALYSYAGAAVATRIPTSVFFDLGGGSLEIVQTEDFKIRRVFSLPLGALRLTYAYGKGDGTFSKKGYTRMRERVADLLPSRRELGLKSDARLIGVGGNLRALARYHQDRTRYPFEKVHNYAMGVDSIDSIGRKLLKMSHNKLAKINAIGGSRAETVVAAACVVRTLMKELGFREVVVSTHGLREGTLAMFLHDRPGFVSGSIEVAEVQDYLRYSSQDQDLRAGYLRSLATNGLLDESERRVLGASLLIVGAPSTISLQSLFFLSMDEDSWLSHEEQLIMALSLVTSKNENAGQRLYSRHKKLLKRKKWVMIRRVASAGKLLNLLERVRAQVRVNRRSGRLEMRIRIPASTPGRGLLKEAIEGVEESFEVPLLYSIEEAPAADVKMIGQEVRVRR